MYDLGAPCYLPLGPVNPPGPACGRCRRQKKACSHRTSIRDPSLEWIALGKLADGTFAEVYRAARQSDGQIFAMKRIYKDKTRKLERISLEIEVARTIRHPHIVHAIASFDRGAYVDIIMDYCPFGSLDMYIEPMRKYPEMLAKKIAIQMLSALVCLHRASIIHRDVKPANIVLCSMEPFVKLIDFGTCKKQCLEDKAKER